MCGITGISVSPSLSFVPGALSESLAALVHRGPDDFGTFEDQKGGIGLGHRRLSIIDCSPLGHQPMTSSDGAVALVFNGEIYNFRALRADLEARGVSFRGNSDTEVLLNLYLIEGDQMLSRLDGIFAFALWDSRKSALLIARDALGVKPLYYAAMQGRFAFASEIKALLHLLPQARELDIAALHRYMSFLWCPGDGTPLKAVRKLMPGEAMWVVSGQISRRWTWYRLPVFRGVVADLDEKTALAGVVSHLRQAVQRQMVADVPVGAFLSGGLDSSAVVTFARELNPDIHCFTIEGASDPDEGFVDDLPYARKVARHLGVPLSVIPIDAKHMASDLERMVAQLDEPLADPASLNVLYISKHAREQGIKVLLSGVGGDDVFTGYRRHRAVQAEKYWDWLPLGVRKTMSQVAQNLDQRSSYGRRLSKLFAGAELVGDERVVEYFRWTPDAALLELYTPETRRALGAEAAIAPMLDFLRPLPLSVSALDRMLALEQRFFLADHNLNYSDKMSMAVGVEVRVPLLDLDLIEFAARIPNGLKQRGSEGKWILKKAMEPYLPHEVIYRQKSGFGAPVRRWMRQDLREIMGDLLSVDSLQRRGLFRPDAVQQLIRANDGGTKDASYTLLSLLCIELWCRSYLDRSVPRDSV
jgi:asparagine synthase (glutamine-hydrolysing)